MWKIRCEKGSHQGSHKGPETTLEIKKNPNQTDSTAEMNPY